MNTSAGLLGLSFGEGLWDLAGWRELGYSHMIAYLHEKEWQASQDLAAAWLTRTEQSDLWKC